jgi:hypothetical protein
MKGLVYVGVEGIKTDAELASWLTLAVAFAGGLPAK